MGALKKFDQLALTLVIMTVVFLLPETAWAGAPGQGIMNIIWKTASRFVMDYLIPHEQHKILSIACVVLTMVALLWHPKAKSYVGRFAGIPLAIFAGVLAYQLIWPIGGMIWGMLPWWGKILAVIGIVLSIGAIFSGAVGIVRSMLSRLWNFAIATLKGENPSELLCWVGALFIAGFINSSYLSNPDNYYWPSWVASAIGLGLIIHKLVKNPVAEIRHKKKHGLTKAGLVVCPNSVSLLHRDGSPKFTKAGTPKYGPCGHDGNKPDAQRCNECGGELRQISWDCQCGQKKIPHERNKCPKCSKDRPPLRIIPGVRGIPPWEAEKRMNDGVKTCPHCGEQVLLYAKYCKRCRKNMEEPDVEAAPSAASPATRTAPPAAVGKPGATAANGDGVAEPPDDIAYDPDEYQAIMNLADGKD